MSLAPEIGKDFVAALTIEFGGNDVMQLKAKSQKMPFTSDRLSWDTFSWNPAIMP